MATVLASTPMAEPVVGMNFRITEEQSMLVDLFERLFAEKSPGERVRACEPTGFDPDLWRAVIDTGAPVMRVPESAGGGGMTLFDAVLVAEAAGKYLASVPLIETIVAARLLSRLEGDAAQSWLDRVVADGAVATIALHSLIEGREQTVPSGAIAQLIIACDGSRVLLCPTGLADPADGRAEFNFGTLPSAAWSAGDERIAVEGPSAVRAFAAAREEWFLLTAAMAAAAGRRALENAADYAKDRHAFGKPIGSYQGLAHPLADSWVDMDSARLMCWRAVWKIANEPDRAGAAIAQAWWWTASRIGDAVIRAMRAFGGYGVTNEYDAELYFRRARGWTLLAGDPEEALARIGERLWAGETTELPEAGEVSIDFDYCDEAKELAAEARAFFKANLTPELHALTYTTDDGHDAEFQKLLAGAGLLFPEWPKDLGGRGLSHYALSAMRRVYGQNDWSTSAIGVSSMVGRIVAKFGTDELKREILPQAAKGEINFALGYSEASGGSDIFAARTKASRDGDDWIIDGSKMFTSQGHIAAYTLLVTRTNVEVPKHAGVTMFVIPLDLPGYEAKPIATVGGERTNTTFYDNMRVPDRYRLGAVDGGATVLAYALTLEQSAADYYVSALDRQMRHAYNWAQTPGADGLRPIDSPDVRKRMARVWTRREILDSLGKRCLWSSVEQCQHKSFGPMAKLFGSEAWVSSTAEMLDLMAPAGLVRGHTDIGMIEQEYRKSIASTVYAGASEVMRSLIAESALGLPKSRM